MKKKKPSRKITASQVFIKSSVIAVIVSIPSLAGFGIGWYYLDNLILAAIIGVIIHFIALGFLLKFQTFFVGVPKPETDL